jgi:hypothetical protein
MPIASDTGIEGVGNEVVGKVGRLLRNCAAQTILTLLFVVQSVLAAFCMSKS